MIYIILLLSCIIALELILQICCFIINKQKAQIKKGHIVIWCIGDCFTSNQYPIFLQKILNDRAKDKKFLVIDKGTSAKNSEYLYHEVVKKQLKIYSPDIVVSMFGLNDKFLDKPYIVKENFFIKFKTYELLLKIKKYITGKDPYSKYNYANLNLIADRKIINHIMHISENKNNLKNNLMEMKRIVKEYPNIYYYPELIHTLTDPYFHEVILKKENYIFKISDFLDFFKLDIKHLQVPYFYFLFAKNFIKVGDIDNAILCAKTATHIDKIYCNLLKHITDLKTDKNISIDTTYQNYDNNKKRYQITKPLYNAVVNELRNKNVTVMPMQYPLFPIQQLKNMLKESPHYDKLIFIENEENFKQAIYSYKKHNIFRNRVLGFCGNLTNLGNSVLAENVANAILKLYN